jgi:hypothetical protein
MVPWPIALLALFYAVVATVSAAALWRSVCGIDGASPLWPLLWLAVSAGATLGLPLLTSWGRRCAVWTSTALIVATLATAALLVGGGHPGAGLAVTCSTVLHALILRYLQQPSVKQWFRATGGPVTQWPGDPRTASPGLATGPLGHSATNMESR